MYIWIWRKLPYGVWGKLGGSVVLTAVVVGLLWYVVFPWAEPILPFDDVQVGDPGGGYGDGSEPGPTPLTTPPADPNEHEIPYATAEPSPSRKR